MFYRKYPYVRLTSSSALALFVCGWIMMTLPMDVFPQNKADRNIKAERVVVANPTGQPLLYWQEPHLMDDSGNVLFTIKGNIIFNGISDKKEDMAILVNSRNLFGKESSRALTPDLREDVYLIRKGVFYIPVPDERIEFHAIGWLDAGKEQIKVKKGVSDTTIAVISSANIPPAVIVGIFYQLDKLYGLSEQVKIKAETDIPAANSEGIIKPFWGGSFDDEWVWDGRFLRPRWRSDPEDVWEFDGYYLRPAYLPDTYEQWEWDGKTLKRTWGFGEFDEWTWDGKYLKPYWNSGSQYVWVIENGYAKPFWDLNPEKEWQIKGEVPIPVIALVILGFADR